MALYLNEVWLRDPSPESFREFIEVFGTLRGEADKIGLTDDMFRLVAGPWLSIEEAKVIFIFDAPDATTTLPAFGGLLAKGLLRKRRLTPMVMAASTPLWTGSSCSISGSFQELRRYRRRFRAVGAMPRRVPWGAI